MLGFSGITGVDPSAIRPRSTPASIPPPPERQSRSLACRSRSARRPTSSSRTWTKTPAMNSRTPWSPSAAAAPSTTRAGRLPGRRQLRVHGQLPRHGSATPERIMQLLRAGPAPGAEQLAASSPSAISGSHRSLGRPGPTVLPAWPAPRVAWTGARPSSTSSPRPRSTAIASRTATSSTSRHRLHPLADLPGDEFPVSFALKGMNLNGSRAGCATSRTSIRGERGDLREKFVFIEPQYGSHKFDVTGPGDYTCGNSMHPLDDVTRGERLIKDVYEAIRNSPHWERQPAHGHLRRARRLLRPRRAGGRPCPRATSQPTLRPARLQVRPARRPGPALVISRTPSAGSSTTRLRPHLDARDRGATLRDGPLTTATADANDVLPL